jgi:hypothetical protein
MAEKASIFQNVQLAIQTALGTAKTPNAKLLSVNIVPSGKAETSPFRAMGNKYASLLTLNKEYSELAISGKPTYNEVVYLLSSLISKPVAVMQGATTAYKWTFKSNTSTEDAATYMTVEQGDATTAWKVKDAKISGLTFDFSRNGIDVSGNGVGGALDITAAVTAGITPCVVVPMQPTELKFYTASTKAGLAGATALTRSFSMQWSLTDKFGLAWPVGQDPVPVEGEPKYSAKVRVATDATGLALITALRAATVAWWRIKVESASLAGVGYPYSMTIDFPAQVSDIPPFTDMDNVSVAEFGLLPITDPTDGAMEINVINKLVTI